jgi:hypothetical protein
MEQSGTNKKLARTIHGVRLQKFKNNKFDMDW